MGVARESILRYAFIPSIPLKFLFCLSYANSHTHVQHPTPSSPLPVYVGTLSSPCLSALKRENSFTRPVEKKTLSHLEEIVVLDQLAVEGVSIEPSHRRRGGQVAGPRGTHEHVNFHSFSDHPLNILRSDKMAQSVTVTAFMAVSSFRGENSGFNR